MEIQRLRQELNELLENVVEHSQRYSDNRPIPSLEISFVLKKINKMQETLTILKYLAEDQEKKSRTNSKAKLALPKMEEIEDDDDEIEAVVEETLLEIEVQPEEAEPVVEIKEEVEIVVEEKKGSIEKLPIKKLVDAFSLNDRYLFANELFSKDMTAFNESVKALDSCPTMEEAQKIIASLSNERQWDDENEHVTSFLSLIERRFM